MKRFLSLVLAVCMLAVVMAGCGGGSGESSPAATDGSASTETSADSETPASETGGDSVSTGITLSFMASQDWIYPAEQQLAKDFEELRGTKIDYQIVPGDQYFNLLLTKLNAGECTDLFGSQSGRFDIVSQLNIEQNAVDLSGESWVERFDEFNAAELTVNGKLYGVTYFDTTSDFYMVYNKKVFDELGLTVPTTFEEYTKVCDAILAAGKVPFYEPAADIWHQVMWFCEIGPRYEELSPGITDKLNSNQTTFAENTFFAECIAQVKQMADAGYFGDNYLSEEYAGLAAAMNGGEYVMTMAKPGSIAEIVAFDPTSCSEEDFGLFFIPTLDSQFLNVHPCGPSKFIYSGSQNVDEAKEYLNFLCSQESLQYMIDNEPKVENLPFSGLTPQYSDETRTFMESEKRGVVFQDSIMYLNPQWMEIGADLNAVLTDTMTPEQLIANIDTRRAEQATANSDANWQ